MSHSETGSATRDTTAVHASGAPTWNARVNLGVNHNLMSALRQAAAEAPRVTTASLGNKPQAEAHIRPTVTTSQAAIKERTAQKTGVLHETTAGKHLPQQRLSVHEDRRKPRISTQAHQQARCKIWTQELQQDTPEGMLATAQAEASQLRHSLTATQKDLIAAQAEISRYELILQDYARSLTLSQAQTQDYLSQLAITKHALTNLQARADFPAQAKAKIDSLESQLKTKQQAFDSSRTQTLAQISGLESQLTATKQALADSRTEAHTLQTALTASQQDLADSRTETLAYQHALAASQDALGMSQTLSIKLQTELDESQREKTKHTTTPFNAFQLESMAAAWDPSSTLLWDTAGVVSGDAAIPTPPLALAFLQKPSEQAAAAAPTSERNSTTEANRLEDLYQECDLDRLCGH